MKRLIVGWFVVVAAVGVLAQGPLTNFMNLSGVTDANGYLLVSSNVPSGVAGPLTSMANLSTRTDANGYLMVAMSAATIAFGTGTATYIPGGVINSQFTAVSNVSTTETDLLTYSLPANSLSANGKGVRVTAWGSLAANANTKSYKLYFGATAVNSHSTTVSGGGWVAQYLLVRTGAATQIAYELTSQVGTGQQGGSNASPTETLSGAVTIKVTGQSGTASNDITALGMMVEALP